MNKQQIEFKIFVWQERTERNRGLIFFGSFYELVWFYPSNLYVSCTDTKKKIYFSSDQEQGKEEEDEVQKPE